MEQVSTIDYKQASSVIVERDEQGQDDTSGDTENEGQAPPVARDDPASQFARIVSTRWATIKFLGIWDTVARACRQLNIFGASDSQIRFSVIIENQPKESWLMRRYGLRDDQWDRIKDFLPGREGHVALNRSRGKKSRATWTVVRIRRRSDREALQRPARA